MTRNQIMAGVLSKGYRSLTDWAKAHGHSPKTLHTVLLRHCYHNSKPVKPINAHSYKTLAILRDLTNTLGKSPLRGTKNGKAHHHHLNG